jgi:adenylate cyclase
MDLFSLQDEVVGKIVSSLSLKLTSEQDAQITRLPTKNLEAYDNYLRAERESYYNVEPHALSKVFAFYSKAIQLDKSFAEAYSGYARVMVEAWRSDRNELIPSALARKRAYDAAGQALSLDPRSSRAYTVLAILQLGDKRHADAIESARMAVRLNTNDAEAHANLALILAYSGEPDEAVRSIEQALVLNPAPQPGFQLLAGITFYNARRYDQSVVALVIPFDSHISEVTDVDLARASLQGKSGQHAGEKTCMPKSSATRKVQPHFLFSLKA